MPWFEDVLEESLSRKKNIAEAYGTYTRYLQSEIGRKKPEERDKKFWQDSLANIVAANQMSADPRSNHDFPEDMPTMGYNGTTREERVENGKKRREHLEKYMPYGYVAGQGYFGVKSNGIYKAMTERMSNEEMEEACRNPGEFSKNLGKQIDHYKMASKNQTKRDEARKQAEAMAATGTRIGGNSPKYEAALDAMRNPPNGSADLYQKVQTVKDYLADKAQVRKTQTGRARFENSMKFLQQNMPPDEFAQYCNDINRQRGSQDPKHKDHISPDQFAPARSTDDIAKEMHANVKAGYQMTERDCAVLAASFVMAQPTNTDRDRQPDFNRKADPATLTRTADEIQRDPTFQEWFKTQTPESLNQAVETGKINSIGNYQKDLEKQRREAREAAEKSAQEEQRKKEAYDKQMKDSIDYKKAFREKMHQLKETNPEGYRKLYELHESNPEEYHKQRNEMLSKLPKLPNEPADLLGPEAPKESVKQQQAPVKNNGPELGGP